MRKTNVLFLCTHNAARSQMAEGFLQEYAGDEFEVYSAGFEPWPVHPPVRQVMEEVGIDIADQYAKDVEKYLGEKHFGYIITVCARAEELCPTFPGMGQRLFWPFEDPATAEGSEEEKLEAFRRVRDQIDTRIREWLVEQGIDVE